MNFTPFNNTGTLEGYCLVKTAEKKITAKGIPYFDMTFADTSGEINAKLWDYRAESHGWIEVNKLVKVRGTISVYNDTEQFRVEKIRPVTDSDNVKIEDFVPSAPMTGELMLGEIRAEVDAFKQDDLRALVTEILERNKEKLLYWPAAFKLHHAVRGGLLYHTLYIMRLAKSVSDIYPFVDRELLISGVILHDIAKLGEFDVAETGIAAGYTVDGTLVGHIVRGAMEVERVGTEIGTPKETRMLLEHMILSHHGDPEFGAAVRPMFPEAEILSELDLLDSRLYEIEQAIQGVNVNCFTARQWALENRKLYNHGRSNQK